AGFEPAVQGGAGAADVQVAGGAGGEAGAAGHGLAAGSGELGILACRCGVEGWWGTPWAVPLRGPSCPLRAPPTLHAYRRGESCDGKNLGLRASTGCVKRWRQQASTIRR